MNLKDAITKRFFDLLKEKNMSINKVAEKSNMMHTTKVQSVNRNKKHSTDVVDAMAYGLDMSLKEFFDDPIFDKIDRE